MYQIKNYTMYQIKNYTVEIDDTSYDVVGKLSDDGKHIVFTVDIDGKEVALDAKFEYQSKEEFEFDCARMLNGPIFTATLYEWGIKKEFQAEISKRTNGDYWMQYLRHRQTFDEDMPDIINEVTTSKIKKDMSYLAAGALGATMAIGMLLFLIF
jgi:hypothetical protein